MLTLVSRVKNAGSAELGCRRLPFAGQRCRNQRLCWRIL